jgi:UDP-galactose transporter B1
VLKAIIIYSLASAVGQNFIYFVITQFNPLVLTTVTTTRKVGHAPSRPRLPPSPTRHPAAPPSAPTSPSHTTHLPPSPPQIFSTLFSVFRNPENSLSGMQWAGTSLVFAGLIGDIAKKMVG